MADPKDAANKLLNKRAAVIQGLSGHLVENTLGRYAKEALCAGEPLSRKGLLAWLERELSKTASARGKLAAEQDPARQLLEGVVRFLGTVSPESTENS